MFVKSIKEIWMFRPLLWSLIISDLRVRYKGSVLGFLWTFMNPLLTLVVYSLIFSSVMRVNVPNYPMFLFVGLLPWTFFASSVQSSCGVVIGKANLVKKIYFPRAILPISVVVASLINYVLAWAIMFPALLLFHVWTFAHWYLMIIPLGIECILSLGMALFVSAVTVYIRDIEHILGIILMLWFYLTPVVFNETMIPQRFLWLFNLNPMKPIIVGFQRVLFWGGNLHWLAMGIDFVVALVVLIVGWSVFTALSKRFAEEV